MMRFIILSLPTPRFEENMFFFYTHISTYIYTNSSCASAHFLSRDMVCMQYIYIYIYIYSHLTVGKQARYLCLAPALHNGSWQLQFDLVYRLRNSFTTVRRPLIHVNVLWACVCGFAFACRLTCTLHHVRGAQGVLTSTHTYMRTGQGSSKQNWTSQATYHWSKLIVWRVCVCSLCRGLRV
jgi:hypothetical protein